jgi:hypothetical protein
MSDNLFTRAARAVKCPDYYTLNDRSDNKADIEDQIEPLAKRPYIASNLSDISQNQLLE